MAAAGARVEVVASTVGDIATVESPRNLSKLASGCLVA